MTMQPRRADELAWTPVPAGLDTWMQVLIGPAEASGFAMRRFRIGPGGSMPSHTNKVEHEQYVLSGCASVGLGARVFAVHGGDVLFIPAGVVHWYRNEGDEPFVFLCLVPNRPDAIELAGDQPPRDARVGQQSAASGGGQPAAPRP